MKRCINIDWLEIYCLESYDHFPCDAEYFRQQGYQVKKRDYGTPQYREMFTIYENDEPFIEIRRNPYSLKREGGIFENNACHIRLSNRACYDMSPIDTLRAFLVAHNYTYKSISRIDICCDFNTFDDGGNVQEFVTQYMRGDVSKVNQPRLSAHGNDTWADGRVINSLKWGSQSSPNTTKLYNKTLELQQGGDKPYIRQRWKDAGLNLSKDIWRIEFSLTSQFQTLRNKKTGEILKKDISAYDKGYKLMQQFFYIYARYFDFRHVERTRNGNLKPKYKCMKRMCLQYHPHDIIYTPTRNLRKEPKPDRTAKILVKKLEAMQYDYTINREYREAASTLLLYFEHYLHIQCCIHIQDKEKEIIDDWFKLRWMSPEYDNDIRLQQQEMEQWKRENKEQMILRNLMKKYGIISQPLGCPF